MSLYYSIYFSHPSTNQTRPCLASEIRQDRVRSGWYGRRHLHTLLNSSTRDSAQTLPLATGEAHALVEQMLERNHSWNSTQWTGADG